MCRLPGNHISNLPTSLLPSLPLPLYAFTSFPKSQSIKDGRLARALTETFCVSYSLQSMVMFRAQFTNPSGHTWLHWYIAVVFAGLGCGYGYIRFYKKIKYFALPNGREDD